MKLFKCASNAFNPLLPDPWPSMVYRVNQFWAYAGQPHNHIGWATSMPFASTNSTNPRTNPRNFQKKILRIGDFKKCTFFESAILNFFFQKKKFFFCLIPMKTRQSLLVSKGQSKFWWLSWFGAHEVLGQHLCTGLYVTANLLMSNILEVQVFSSFTDIIANLSMNSN